MHFCNILLGSKTIYQPDNQYQNIDIIINLLWWPLIKILGYTYLFPFRSTSFHMVPPTYCTKILLDAFDFNQKCPWNELNQQATIYSFLELSLSTLFLSSEDRIWCWSISSCLKLCHLMEESQSLAIPRHTNLLLSITWKTSHAHVIKHIITTKSFCVILTISFHRENQKWQNHRGC